MKPWIWITIAVALVMLLVAVVAYRAGSDKYQTCTGAAECTFCKNCSRCKWCREHPEAPCGVKLRLGGK